jgi:hypothetical protein
MSKKKITALASLEVHWVDKADYFNKDEAFFLPIPDEIINHLEWKDGDELVLDIKDGKIVINKK